MGEEGVGDEDTAVVALGVGVVSLPPHAATIRTMRHARSAKACLPIAAKLHLNQRAALHPVVDIELTCPLQLLLKLREELSSPGLILHQDCRGREVSLNALFQVKGERGVGVQVGNPAPAARGAGDDDAAIDYVEPDLDAMVEAGLAPLGGDVDDPVPLECAPDFIVQREFSSSGAPAAGHPAPTVRRWRTPVGRRCAAGSYAPASSWSIRTGWP